MNYRLLIFFIIVIILIIILKNKIIKKCEGFGSYVHRYCGDCGKLGRYRCSKCVDCGYCIDQFGRGECIPGDIKGPYFRKDCAFWEYTQPWLVRGTSPGSRFGGRVLAYKPYLYRGRRVPIKHTVIPPLRNIHYIPHYID